MRHERSNHDGGGGVAWARWAVVLLLAGAGCGEQQAQVEIRNVLLVTFDTTRADRLGCYGHEGAQTPHVDRLAAQGVRFARCISTSPLTLPAHASILTGLYPFRHGARNNGTHRLADTPTLADRLADADFATGAVVSAFVLDASYGLDRGFDHYDDDLSGGEDDPGFAYAQTTADDTARRAVQWLESQDGPFFLWVHFYDPHRPFDPPEPYASAFGRRRHDGELAYTDARVGTLLEAVEARGQLSETLVVVTSDHGESFGDHGEKDHGLFVYESTTHVPLVFRHPSLASGHVVDEVVSVVDIAPTVLDLLGLDPIEPLDGVSLAPVLRQRSAAAPARRVYSEAMFPYYNHGWSDLRSLTDGEGRYIRAPRPELYLHDQDPDEQANVFVQQRVRARDYERAMAALLGDGERDTRGAAAPTDDELSALAELGYVFHASPERPLADALELQDPKDTIQEYLALARCKQLLLKGKEQQALAQLKTLLEVTPGSPEPSRLLFEVLVRLERLDEATQVADELVAGPSPLLEDFINRAAVDRLSGRDRWQDALIAGARQFPRDVRPRVQRGDWLVADGRGPEASASYREALALDDGSLAAWVGLARALAISGRTDEAVEALGSARAVDGPAVDALLAKDKLLSELADERP